MEAWVGSARMNNVRDPMLDTHKLFLRVLTKRYISRMTMNGGQLIKNVSIATFLENPPKSSLTVTADKSGSHAPVVTWGSISSYLKSVRNASSIPKLTKAQAIGGVLKSSTTFLFATRV